MFRLIFLAFLLVLPTVLDLQAQSATPSSTPSAANLSEPITLCLPGAGPSSESCYYRCGDRRRPADQPCVVPPKPTFSPIAEYTDKARRKRIEGLVVLQLTVGRDGKVGDVKVTQGLEPSLDKQSVDTIRQWRFEPATLEGKPVAVSITSETTFHLR